MNHLGHNCALIKYGSVYHKILGKWSFHMMSPKLEISWPCLRDDFRVPSYQLSAIILWRGRWGAATIDPWDGWVWKPKNLWFWVFLDARRKTFYILYSIIHNYVFYIYYGIHYVYIYMYIYMCIYIIIYTIWALIHMVTVYGLQNWSNLILQPPTATGSRHLLQRHIPCKWLVPLKFPSEIWWNNEPKIWQKLGET